MADRSPKLTRRQVVGGGIGLGALAGLGAIVPGYAQALDLLTRPAPADRRVTMDLAIRGEKYDIAGATAFATTINGSVPGPLIELYEQGEAVLRVTNHLDEDSSIHWHGILLPFEMDGVPGVTFPGIPPGETFEARFPVRQSGTYWYHSHSSLQEQTGVYGPLVVHPAEPEPFGYDRDYVVMLSDWTFEDPHRVMARLKKMSDYYNFQQRTVGDFFSDVGEDGWKPTVKDRLAWARMRMSPTDIADVTGATYTYLMNGLHPKGNWTGLFRAGERVRLRLINGSAMSYFNVRLPGLPMTVVQSDGQNVRPVEVDELQIGVAETFDVIVRPPEDRAYTVFAEAMDRSGFARGTLAPRREMSAAVPELRPRPLRSMVDMGMDMDDMQMDMGTDMEMEMASEGGMAATAMSEVGSDGSGGDHGGHAGHADHGGHGDHGEAAKPGMERGPGPVVARHGPDRHGPGNISVAMVQRNRLAERGTGLEDVDHRVLVYADLRSLERRDDRREPSREIELHLTGNMERYMWSFDGKKLSEVDEPIEFQYGERLRLILVNDTMMEHPIHLHGMWMELENGADEYRPRQHTVSVKPAERLSVLITADARGRWAFHCHLLYHMEMGMFRVVEVK